MTSVFIVACGAAFHASPDEAAGGAPTDAASAGGEASGGAPNDQGALGGAVSQAGEAATEGGSGGAAIESSCALLGGVEWENGHCYVDITVGTATQPESLAACEALPGGDAHLLILDDLEEQAFILKNFLQQFENTSDAWLGLGCSAQSHPDIADCHCEDCSAEDLEQKQAAWTWLDGRSTNWGWVNGNPNATVRCAALGYNPTPGVEDWGWVDRACNLDRVTPIAPYMHTYRTICERE